MRVRYYADAHIQAWHDRTLGLLGTLHDEHAIPVEIDRIDERLGPITDFPGEVRSSTPEAVSERDRKRKQALNQNIEPTPSEAFKRYGEFEIAGNVAVVGDDGTVQRASTLPGFAEGYGPGAEDQAAIDFLEAIVSSPSNRICVECLHLLAGEERFCPDCGRELS